MHLEVCASSGSAQQSVIGRTKWPAIYIRYFALGLQLPTICTQVTNFFALGNAVMLKKKREKKKHTKDFLAH